MPINDYDGTSWSDIGKIHDYDGTTWRQIAKAYDNDGTTGSLIYSAETQYYPGTQVYKSTESSIFSDSASDTFTSYAAAGTNKNGPVLYIALDLTGINALTVTGSFSGHYAGCWIATAAQLKYGNYAYPYYGIGPGASENYYTLMQRVVSGSSAGFNFDVSALTGTYYLCAGAYCNGGDAATATISTAIGE